MHIGGELLVLCSPSPTVYSRPKMTGSYDDHRKSSELSTKDLKVN